MKFKKITGLQLCNSRPQNKICQVCEPTFVLFNFFSMELTVPRRRNNELFNFTIPIGDIGDYSSLKLLEKKERKIKVSGNRLKFKAG